MDENSQYRDLFFEETAEHLENLNDCVLELETNPDSVELIDSIFRSAHTLKGMAATMGYETMTKLTHKMENVFQMVKDHQLKVTSDIVSLLFDCLDRLSLIVEDLKNEVETDLDIVKDLIHQLEKLNQEEMVEEVHHEKSNHKKEILNELSETDKMLMTQAQETGFKTLGIQINLDETCTMKGPRVYLILNSLESLGEVIYSEPIMEELESGEFENTFSILFFTMEDVEKIKKVILSDIDVDSMLIKDYGNENNEIIEAIEDEKKLNLNIDNKKEEVKKKNKLSPKKLKEHQHQSIKVDIDRLDSFMNLVSELVVFRTRLENVSKDYDSTEIQEPLGQVARITSELQELVLKIRMQQVSVVTNRFPRMVRDLAKDLGKDIELIIEGEETELDRTVVSELSEPLIHLIRNSADHGIEDKDRRLELGKPETGQIKLSAYQQGNRVIITLADDGKGLDVDFIAKKAESKGISVDGLTDKEILHLIFHPGFSTAQKVTNVSGRGVGMDVVHSKIESLGGSIELSSEINKGMTVNINLPLTLSIIQSLMVKIKGETFALPLGVIEKVISVTSEDIVAVHNKNIFNYRGKATPVIRLNEVLDLGQNESNQNHHLIMILLGNKQYALLVDELIGQQEIVIKKLGKELHHLKNYLGATILGNGDVTLILDINSICYEGTGEDDE